MLKAKTNQWNRSASPLTPEQRILAMREKSQMALAHIVKLTAGGLRLRAEAFFVVVILTRISLYWYRYWKEGTIPNKLPQ